MKFKWVNNNKWTIGKIWVEMQPLMKTNKLLSVLSAKMIGNSNVKESLINSKSNPSKIQSNGDLTWTHLETAAILSKKSNFLSNNSFPNSRSVL